MIDDDGIEWIDLGNGNAYCTELKDGMVAMLNGGSLVLMSIEAFEVIFLEITGSPTLFRKWQPLPPATVSPTQPIGADHD